MTTRRISPCHERVYNSVRTPISQGNEIRLAAHTNIGGKAKGDVKQLKSVKSGAAIKVEKIG